MLNYMMYSFLRVNLANRFYIVWNNSCASGAFHQRRNKTTLAPSYQPRAVEDVWQNQSPPCVNISKNKRGAFNMILPPPNVTGDLHLGHALNTIVQDVICRHRTQLGYDVNWVPGTDHAGIATQVVVERKLLKEGYTKKNLDRETFNKEIWQWKNEKEDNIQLDLQSLGCILNWDKKYFTLDKQQSKAVAAAFTKLFDRKLINRQRAMVNWSCALESAISDIEVESRDIRGPTDIMLPGYDRAVRFGQIYTIRYNMMDNYNNDYIEVATTRPETLLGDVAVAVHPEDERYKHLRDIPSVQLWHPFRKEPIPLIFDLAVDREFGTGAVKLTPAHDRKDFEIAKKHLIDPIDVFTPQGIVAENYNDFAGLQRFVAREQILQALASLKLLTDTQPHNMMLPVCSRTGDIIEYLLLEQWFLKCKDLAMAAASEVRSGRLKIIPPNFETEWYRWLDNCEDWCISRQLWWGHRIPAYWVENNNNNTQGFWLAAENDVDAIKKAKDLMNGAEPLNITRDIDVLDTWFSSSLLPFSVHSWPDPEYINNYPLDLMQTGHDILFFWVARMVMMGLALTERLPFNNVLLNGIVCDTYGRKMSKSLGNIIQPYQVTHGASLESMQNELVKNYEAGIMSAAEVKKSSEGLKTMLPNGIPECGTDALRFTLCSHNIKNHFINFNVKECHMNKLFFNKIWQATRFLMSAADKKHMDLSCVETLNYVPMKVFDLWILGRLAHTIKICAEAHAAFNLHLATAALKQFFYSNVCDVYLEIIKADVNTEKPAAYIHLATLATCISWGLQALSPFAPYISHELLQQLPNNIELHINKYQNEALDKEINDILFISQSIRQLKSRNKISKKHEPIVQLQAQTPEVHKLLVEHLPNILALTQTTGIDLLETPMELTAEDLAFTKLGDGEFTSTAGHLCTFVLKTNELYRKERADVMEEIRKLNTNKLEKLQSELAVYRLRFENEGYIKMASPQIQKKHREKVLLITTVGEIDIELWCKECPKTCRNFIQLCMEGYYNNTVFHRVVPGFIVQGGDPNGDGNGGDSIYGEVFKDEFHQRLRYTRRGLVGMANSGKNDNGSQFFFTMAPTPELQNVNTLFGKVTGNTIFNMIKLEEGLVDHNERPLYVHTILRCEILNNPFTDIVPRKLKQTTASKVNKEENKQKKIKNFKLLSFGEEAAEDEDETYEFLQHIAGRAKSLHDVADDPYLSRDTFIKDYEPTKELENEKLNIKSNEGTNQEKDSVEYDKIISKKHENVLYEKLKGMSGQSRIKDKLKTNNIASDFEIDDDDTLKTQDQQKLEQKEHKKKKIRLDIQTLKKSYQNNKSESDKVLNGAKERKTSKSNNLTEKNEFKRQYLNTRETYQKLKEKLPKSGAEREIFTLSLLSKFRSKLEKLNYEPTVKVEKQDPFVAADVETDIKTDSWLTHTLCFENAAIPVLAKDASSKTDDWYDVTDPRNPINKRKRGSADQSKANTTKYVKK